MLTPYDLQPQQIDMRVITVPPLGGSLELRTIPGGIEPFKLRLVYYDLELHDFVDQSRSKFM